MSHVSGARAPRRTLLALVATALLTLLVLSPSGSARATAGSEDLPPGASWVRVGHFVPGMGTTSVQVTPLDGSGTAAMLSRRATYSQVSSYEKLTPGRYSATVRETSASAGSKALLSRTFEIGRGQARTIAVVGTSAQPRLVLLTDDLTPPATGTARVRLLSASQTADSVTVQAVGGPTIAQDAVLGQITGYVTVPAGNWTLRLSSTRADATAQVPIASGSVYTVVAVDRGDRVGLRVVTDAAGAMVRPMGGAKTGEGGTATKVAPGIDVRGTWELLFLAGAGVGLARHLRRARAGR